MMKTLAVFLLLATLTQRSDSAKSAGCGKDPISYNDEAWKMKRLQFQDQFAVQGVIKRSYQVRLPKSEHHKYLKAAIFFFLIFFYCLF